MRARSPILSTRRGRMESMNSSCWQPPRVAGAASCALTWPDIDFNTRVMRISKSLEQTKGGLRVKPTKSEKPRDIPLPRSAIEVLREHRNHQSENRRLFGADYRDDLNLVF